MKHLFYLSVAVVFGCLASCTGQYDNVEKYAGETVYPASFDTIYGRVGYERIEIDLCQAGRLPSSKMNFGKASRTVVEYDGDKHYIDSVCSWVNVTGLTESKLYRIKVYTEDSHGNASIPREIAMIPFTSLDRDLMGVASPKLAVSPSSLVAEWPNGLSSVVMDYYSLTYKYADAGGDTVSGSTVNPRFFCSNLPAGKQAVITVNYKVVPIMNDGVTRILDTVILTIPLEITMPTIDTEFSPAEATVLRANGITTFTSAAVQSVRKLVYPLHMSTFMDLFYFPNVDSLDLTGYGLKNVIPTLVYNRNSVQTACGGGSWQPFMRRVEKPADLSIASTATLQDLLESGQLKWVRYIPGTMELDKLLEPYVASGVVKLVQNSDPIFPNEVFIDPQFFVKGQPVDNNWEMDSYYSGDFLPRAGYSDIGKFNPASETVNGDNISLHLDQLIQSDGKNIYKCVIRKRSASFAMNLPKEYIYDSQKYRTLKFKMFCGSSVETMSGSNGDYLQPWIRPMNYMWNFGGNSIYGQENWDVSFTNDRITNAEIRNSWKEYTVDMGSNNWWDSSSNRRNRCIVFNIGHEPSSFTYDANNEVVLYIADIRLIKTQ
jgi:hypothetical protein